MKNRRLLVWAIALLMIGLAGFIVAALLPGGPVSSGRFASLGQQIYYSGSDANGPIPRSVAGGGITGVGMMGSPACVDCHGADGRGGRIGMMFGNVVIPDIRYSTLTTARSEGTATIPAWTDADIARAIRDGVEPSGQSLKSPMPRWSMTDTDMTDVIAYLKELSPR